MSAGGTAELLVGAAKGCTIDGGAASPRRVAAFARPATKLVTAHGVDAKFAGAFRVETTGRAVGLLAFPVRITALSVQTGVVGRIRHGAALAHRIRKNTRLTFALTSAITAHGVYALM